MKLVTEILGGPQAETVKRKPVKLVTEILGGPQAETVKEKAVKLAAEMRDGIWQPRRKDGGGGKGGRR